eukprot:3160603-Ditylum_brightwellii.AAC.1
MEVNTEGLQRQFKMVCNHGTEEDLKHLQKGIEEVKKKACSLQNLASTLRIDACYRVSALTHMK